MRSTQSVIEGRESGEKAKLDSVTLRKAKGGWSIEHNMSGPMPGYSRPPQHVFTKGSDFLAHVAKVMGVPGASEEVGEKEHDA